MFLDVSGGLGINMAGSDQDLPYEVDTRGFLIRYWIVARASWASTRGGWLFSSLEFVQAPPLFYGSDPEI